MIAHSLTPRILTDWIFGSLFTMIGILNILLVDVRPGLAYLALALVYLPPSRPILHRLTGMTAPFSIRIILGLLVIWGTLAVGDLAELAGL